MVERQRSGRSVQTSQARAEASVASKADPYRYSVMAPMAMDGSGNFGSRKMATSME